MITGRKRYVATEPADPLHLALYKALTSPSWTSYARIAKASGKPVNRKLLQNILHQYLDNSDVGRALPLRGFEGAFFATQKVIGHLLLHEKAMVLRTT